MKTLTTGEIAKICDVNLRTVIRWIERGDLKGFKLPGRGNNRITLHDFVNFLKLHDMPIPAELIHDRDNHILIVDDEVPFSKSIQRVLGAPVIQQLWRTMASQQGAFYHPLSLL